MHNRIIDEINSKHNVVRMKSDRKTPIHQLVENSVDSVRASTTANSLLPMPVKPPMESTT